MSRFLLLILVLFTVYSCAAPASNTVSYAKQRTQTTPQDTLIVSANTFINARQFPEALKELQSAGKYGDTANLNIGYARYFSEQGDTAQALSYARKGYALSRTADNALWVGYLLIRTGERRQAIEYLAYTAGQGSLEAKVGHAENYAALKMFPEALQAANDARSALQNTSIGADVARQRRLPAQAQQAQVTPETEKLWRRLYFVYLGMKDYETALQIDPAKRIIGINLAVDNASKEILVAGVTENGPAEAAGIKTGDVIVAFAGKPTVGMTIDDMVNLISAQDIQTSVPVTLRRGGVLAFVNTRVGLTEQFLFESVQKSSTDAVDRAKAQNQPEAVFQYLSTFHAPGRFRDIAYAAAVTFFAERPEKQALFDSFGNRFPDAVSFFPPEFRLRYVGPSGMTVADILKHLKTGMSPLLISSRIKTNEKPYRDFTLEEMSYLQKEGMPDTVIAAMMDVTYQARKQAEEAEKIRKLQEENAQIRGQLQEIQKQQKQQQTQRQQTQQTLQQPGLGDVLIDCTGKVLGLEACKNLPWPANDICRAGVRAKFSNCP